MWTCSRYRWLGGLPHEEARRRIQAAHMLVHPSRMEGNAHVVRARMWSSTPCAAARRCWLSALPQRVRDELALPARLRDQCVARAALFEPAREAAALTELADEVLQRESEGTE